MICKLCGKEVPDDAAYCDGCGNSFGAVEKIADTEPLADGFVNEQPLEMPAEEVDEPVGTADAGTEDLTAEATPSEEPLTGEIAPEQAAVPKKINSHIVAAIFTTVLLFNWILGIPAVIFARECELAAEKGQMEIAERFSRRALNFTWVGVALSLAVAALLTLFIVVMRAAGPMLLYMR